MAFMGPGGGGQGTRSHFSMVPSGAHGASGLGCDTGSSWRLILLPSWGYPQAELLGQCQAVLAMIPCATLPGSGSSHWSGCGSGYIQLCATAMGTPETHCPEPQAQQDPPVTVLPPQHQLFLQDLPLQVVLMWRFRLQAPGTALASLRASSFPLLGLLPEAPSQSTEGLLQKCRSVLTLTVLVCAMAKAQRQCYCYALHRLIPTK